MKRPRRRLRLLGAGWLFLGLLPSAAAGQAELSTVDGSVGTPGGRLVVALRSEPKTLNPAVAMDDASLTVIRRMMADLLHIDRHSQEVEPALAKAWSRSPDGLRYRLELREGLRFSDGHPVDAGDVLFSFEAYLDPETPSPSRGLLIVGGEPIRARRVGSRSVEFELAKPYAAGERLFDSLMILPEHHLRPALEAGRLGEAWGLATAPTEIAGLGPFRLRERSAGQRIVLERNPHYWKVDRAGNRLPYLDEIVFVFVPGEDAQVLRFLSGATDVIDSISPKSFSLLEREQRRRGLDLRDLGPGLDISFLFFNLNDLSPEEHPKRVEKQAWFRSRAFRRAVSAAIDRQALLRLVYRGRATPLWSNVSPGNRFWFNPSIPEPPRSVERARELLRSAGFRWDPEGRLRDSAGVPVELSIATSSGNPERLEMATILQNDLQELGMEVRVAPLEHRALVDRVTRTFRYDAAILSIGGGDADPNPQMGLLVSDGNLHLWRLGGQSPLGPWQAEIDRLMRQQLTVLEAADRKRLFDRVQALMAENLPAIFLVSPNVLVGARKELGGFRPAVLRHSTLWNAEQLFWRDEPKKRR